MKTIDERPILMQADMVLATLDDRKMNTRRLAGLEDVNSYPGNLSGAGSMVEQLGYQGLCKSDYYIKNKTGFKTNPGVYHWFIGEQPQKREINPILVRCPYGKVGDHLWVRERWAALPHFDHLPPRYIPHFAEVIYCASGENPIVTKWRPSIFMPRWASRIMLEIVEIRVERLRKMPRDDAFREGIYPIDPYKIQPDLPAGFPAAFPDYQNPHNFFTADPVRSFASLWDRINGEKKGCAWIDNPFVWVVVFKRLAQNG